MLLPLYVAAWAVWAVWPQAPLPAAAPQAKPSSAPTSTLSPDQTRDQRLQALLNLQEPGEQRRGLEAFLKDYPNDPDLVQIYTTLIDDATQLSDDRGVLEYNEKLEAADPTDLSQRIKTINLLLVETDAADRARALAESNTFAQMVEERASEPAPAALGAASYRVDMARMRALAALFQGTANQALGNNALAAQQLERSLLEAQTEEAAEHLGEVYRAEGKTEPALDSFALAMALPGDTISGRAQLELEAKTLYRQLHHGSDVGLGDLVLRAFDQVAVRDAAEQMELAGTPSGGTSGANATTADAAEFTLEGLDGSLHKLADGSGKVLVVDFWATWCQPCLIQHPLLAAVAQQYENNHNVMFVAVNEDENKSLIAPFLKQHGWGSSTWLDAGLATYLSIDSLPTTLILDPHGKVVYRQSGFTPATFQTELAQAIAEQLARAFPAAGPSPAARSR